MEDFSSNVAALQNGAFKMGQGYYSDGGFEEFRVLGKQTSY